MYKTYCVCGERFYCSMECHIIVHKARGTIHLQQKKAREYGLKSTLTIGQWVWAIKYFDFKCAYCLVNPYESLDHYIPIMQGGGTTLENCIPSCIACNLKKSHFTGPALQYIFDSETYRRVLAFVSLRQAYAEEIAMQ